MTFTTDITKRRQVGELRLERTLRELRFVLRRFSPGNLTVDIKVLHQLLEFKQVFPTLFDMFKLLLLLLVHTLEYTKGVNNARTINYDREQQ